uniref:Uncharacterized protein n=1 Tax=Rhizophagus irregularis (strain DAOM 181602 / DAOM 197198 / MUCL 43194) TaxID=747089 RepID=U9THQ8_RHIID
MYLKRTALYKNEHLLLINLHSMHNGRAIPKDIIKLHNKYFHNKYFHDALNSMTKL